ncbi:hypothetical protein QYF61_023797 [Mycteria americana]|uniref:Core shell protein Gag P30 domain-containing protein n=1 Tax=Mycteria americana TaxID=33587 RepID=A0AAN7NP94_MYCAM|nr:hypothetical protein QYF61_023797 [Mycteria americana]
MEELEEISEKEKRPERAPARTDLSTGDSFSSSPAVGRRDWDIRKKGGLVDSKHRIGIYVLKEKKGKPRCIEWENLEEDIQLSVAPPKQPKSDSSSGNGVVSAISKRTRGEKPIVGAPLRQAAGPEGTPVSVRVPFTACDLLNCKQAVGSYRNNPEGIPNWGDVQALLEYLFPTEERRRILEKAREGLIQQGAGVPNTDMYLPKEDPEWDPDTIRQGDKETPSAFSERLCEVARKWTDLDPEDDSNSKLFNRLFIGQAAADIRKR